MNAIDRKRTRCTTKRQDVERVGRWGSMQYDVRRLAWTLAVIVGLSTLICDHVSARGKTRQSCRAKHLIGTWQEILKQDKTKPEYIEYSFYVFRKDCTVRIVSFSEFSGIGYDYARWTFQPPNRYSLRKKTGVSWFSASVARRRGRQQLTLKFPKETMVFFRVSDLASILLSKKRLKLARKLRGQWRLVRQRFGDEEQFKPPQTPVIVDVNLPDLWMTMRFCAGGKTPGREGIWQLNKKGQLVYYYRNYTSRRWKYWYKPKYDATVSPPRLILSGSKEVVVLRKLPPNSKLKCKRRSHH